ncbi:MAG: PIN domain nuclease [Desulfurococcales archaeon]|nr:PIN domain nuclease [Desulfurococcales archaeon]
MNKKNYQILLDTSFLLPFLGFKTDDIIINTLPKLRRYYLYYSDLSLLEALWKISKIVKKENLEIIIEGIRLIKKDLYHIRLDERAIEIAINLYMLGHKDLIDDLLYGIAISQDLMFLSIDRSLESFIKEHGYENVFIHPEEIE